MSMLTYTEEQTGYRSLTRLSFMKLASTALEENAWRFARDILLEWLGQYPGDLQAGLFYAQALMGEGHASQAASILEGLHRADPEFLAVVETALELGKTQAQGEACLGNDGKASSAASFWNCRYYALTGRNLLSTPPAVWAQWLSEVRLALEDEEYPAARGMIERLIEAGELNELVAVTHLRILQACAEVSLAQKIALAQDYFRRWPDTLAVMLFLGHHSMLGGDAGQGLSLLHQAVARDVGGQVAERLWGEGNPYRSLWPEVLDLTLRLPIPARIAARLGWNRLPSHSPSTDPIPSVVTSPSEEDANAKTLPEWLDFGNAQAPSEHIAEQDFESFEVLADNLEFEAASPIEESARPASLKDSLEAERFEKFPEIAQELKRLAEKLTGEDLHQVEARFPVYVVISARRQMEQLYGAPGFQEVHHAVERLVATVQRRKGWDACAVWLDDDSSCAAFGLKPISTGDPKEVKQALHALDASLAKRGEMIGALLIVGGDDVVPFHPLPNPVDDDDDQVASDNPYATRSENYFVPEWPVGRLPAGSAVSKEWLLHVLENMARFHTDQMAKKSWIRKMLDWLKRAIILNLNGANGNFGYSAAAWREAARAVYKAIGDADELYFSPPMGVDRLPASSPSMREITTPNSLYGVPALAGRLGYFNLHGMLNAVEWYGQADVEDFSQMPTLPIALSPAVIRKPKNALEGGLPQVIFSEACYGAHVEGRQEAQSIALKFLQCGSLAFIGSTGMSYGTVEPPLQAADLLASFFWRALKEGMPAGEALRQAKLELALEMHQRQGYLDGEDQKTLISFVLYGDPLAMPLGMRVRGKGHRRQLKPLEEFEVVCDRAGELDEEEVMPEAMVSYVRELVAKYLPGMEGAQMRFTSEHVVCDGESHICPTFQLRNNLPHSPRGKARHHEPKPARQLVTLSKRIVSPKGEHTHYARLRINETGRVVKLVVSR